MPRGTALEPRRRPVQGRSKATVDVILEAAAQVFEAEGYAGGSTNRIAERAGVSIGTLYQYFPNKESLAVALLERHLAEGMRLLQAWEQQVRDHRLTLRQTLRGLISGMVALHAGRPRLQHILLEETPLPPRVHELLLDSEREAAQTTARLLAHFSEVTHPQLDLAAPLIVQSVMTLTHHWAAHPDQGMSSGDLALELERMLEAYLCARGPASPEEPSPQ